MRWTHPATRGGFVVLLFLGYPWAVVTLQRIVPGPAMMLGVVPVAATAAIFGSRVGLIAVAVASSVDYLIARSLKVIALELLPWASLLSLCAYLVLVFGIGALRQLLLRVRSANGALAEVNKALAEEARLRSQMAAELQAHTALYSSLLNSMAEGVGLFDIEDRFVYANAAAEHLFSTAHGQLVGQCLRALVDAEGLRALETARGGNSQQECVAYKLTTRSEGMDGRHLLVTETRLNPGPSVTAPILRVMHDVTVRERLEQEQRELARQVQHAQAVQSLGVLAGGVAHDFNNLLTGVLGHTDLAMMRLGRASPVEIRHSLCEIRDFAREAAALAKQMLAYAGKGTVATEVLNVGDVAGEALRLVHSTVAARAFLEQDISAALPNVRGDRTQLRQVIVNLLMNAVESLDARRGTVRFTLDSQLLGPDQLGGFWKPERPQVGKHVVLTVSDNGEGMSEETLAHIFEPFFSTKVVGRGMGLAATLGIIQAHRSSIGVASTPGVGSTFRVLLPPQAEPPSVPITIAAPQNLARGQGLILLIDDERAVRSTASLMLEELGYQALVASTGREGLERLAVASAAIRLVLLDLTMPEMDGRDTLVEIRRASHTVPVLLISGYHHGEVDQLLKEPGVVGFLQKPLQLDQLARSVREALSDRTTGDVPHPTGSTSAC
jgi:two-component system, cell cycle sensor histidine kinase and response regulator CckA